MVSFRGGQDGLCRMLLRTPRRGPITMNAATSARSWSLGCWSLGHFLVGFVRLAAVVAFVDSVARQHTRGMRRRVRTAAEGRPRREQLAMGSVAISGSDETADGSRLTSNRMFARGGRPRWPRSRDVSPSRTSASRSNPRRPLGVNEVAMRPAEERVCADARKPPLLAGMSGFREPALNG